MDNYDSNMIKPVDSLQNITGLAPARRREQRRRRQNFDSENKEHQDKHNDEEIVKNQFDESISIDDGDDSKIDFCA